jgi:hypothetical protein
MSAYGKWGMSRCAMTDHMQRLIAETSPGDLARLDALEAAVWTRVGEVSERRRMDRVRVAAVAVALIVGVTNGGLMVLAPRPQPSEMRIFSVSSGLSPFASLDVKG